MFPVYYSITSLPSQYTLFLEYIHNILEKDSSIFFKKKLSYDDHSSLC